MKKIKSLFLALLAMMLAVPSLHAQGNYIIGAPVALEDELDGLEVVFEGYSDDSTLEVTSETSATRTTSPRLTP